VPFLKQHPYIKISVESHTDNVGTHTHNLGLSERRATSVKFALMNYGITSKRITVKGVGETRPIGSNHTQQGRQKNRRVEIIVFRSFQ
jgi:outer membrane protein OmpA-like peptidoglycan-associated protein